MRLVKNLRNSKSLPMWAWALNDWANSAFSTTVMAGFFPLFFKKYYSYGMDPLQSTAQLGYANAVGSLAIALASPFLGALSDAAGYKKKFLFLFTYLGIVMTLCLAFVSRGQWLWASLIYAIASFGHAGSTNFYDALLPSVASRERVDFVSALGYSLGYLGGGILFAVNIVMYLNPSWFGISSGAEAIRISFFMVGLWWALFSLPIFFLVKEPEATGQANLLKASREAISELRLTLQRLPARKSLLFFLISFYFYNDGVGTTIKMAVDYGLSLGFKDADLISALLLVQFVGFPAAYAFGVLSKRFHPKVGIYFSIGVYTLAIILASRMQHNYEFYVLAVLIGLVQGGIQSLSRSYFTRLIDLRKSGEFFGLFNLLGRFQGTLGPALMGTLGLLLGDARLGILSVALTFLIGGIFLAFVNEVQAQKEIL